MLQKVTAGFILSSSGTLCSNDESMRVKKGRWYYAMVTPMKGNK